jgi:hypothetical protein
MMARARTKDVAIQNGHGMVHHRAAVITCTGKMDDGGQSEAEISASSWQTGFIYLDGLPDNCWTVVSIEGKCTKRFKY